jgi:hypothetical protein
MHFDRWLEDADSAMRLGGLADRVVLALARVQHSGVEQLRPADKSALQDAVLFLERAKRGFDWLDQGLVSSNSRSFVSSFSAAARSFGGSPATFVHEMEQLEDTLNRLAVENPVEDSRLHTTRQFFGRLASEAADAVKVAVTRTPHSNVSTWSHGSGS